MDGTYCNVPALPLHTEKFRGKRQFGTDVLINNWFEDRSKYKESSYLHNTTYRIDYPGHPDARPDTVLRRKLLLAQQERPAKLLTGHHDIDDRKNLITWYDEHYNGRPRPIDQQFPHNRRWEVANDRWVPEKTDYPLLAEPTSWGLSRKKGEETHQLQRQRTMPDMRYHIHPCESYKEAKRVGIPKVFSTALDKTNAINKNINYRNTLNSAPRLPSTRDVLDIQYDMFKRSNIPRTYFYLGKVPDVIDQETRNKFPFLPAPHLCSVSSCDINQMSCGVEENSNNQINQPQQQQETTVVAQ
ncbi:unnamed protein product [Didymodactylos carnosus]|uniref:Uncharacterized protein n=1 Tax=Didymodactylos carnosus TaxID=1234261 RepID=A0A814FMU8_9BILA|nr:unnamed protein product [Didymodactylos carnosus]CAF3754753.1 unnamed protein product [Didymodactylos carnosus]